MGVPSNTPRRRTHSFTLLITPPFAKSFMGLLVAEEAMAGRLYGSGCDDATLSVSGGGLCQLTFDREAESYDEAVRTAIRDAKSGGAKVRGVVHDAEHISLYQNQPWYIRLWRRRHQITVPLVALKIWLRSKEYSLGAAWQIASGLAGCRMEWLIDSDEVFLRLKKRAADRHCCRLNAKK